MPQPSGSHTSGPTPVRPSASTPTPKPSGPHTSTPRPSSFTAHQKPSSQGSPKPSSGYSQGPRPSGQGLSSPRPATGHTQRPTVHQTGPRPRNPRPTYVAGGGGAGCGGTLIAMIIMMVLLIVCVVMFINSGSDTVEDTTQNQSVAQSTIEREKLASNLCTPIDTWYQDDWGDWLDSASSSQIDSMVKQMKSFYKETGVQPFVWVIGEEGRDITDKSIEKACEKKYDELFPDSGHLLLAISEYPNGSGDYISEAFAGANAMTVMDTEARGIMLDYLNMYYADESISEAQMFGNTFESTAARIMKAHRTTKQMGIMAVIVLLIVAMVVVFIWSRIRKKKLEVEKQKEENAQQQFNANLEKENVAVTCPSCGATIQVRRGTSAPCEYCGSYFTVDANGQIVGGQN